MDNKKKKRVSEAQMGSQRKILHDPTREGPGYDREALASLPQLSSWWQVNHFAFLETSHTHLRGSLWCSVLLWAGAEG